MSFKKFLFILSKEAAGGRNLPTAEEIREYVNPNLDVEIVKTEYKNHTTELAREFGQKIREQSSLLAAATAHFVKLQRASTAPTAIFRFFPAERETILTEAFRARSTRLSF